MSRMKGTLNPCMVLVLVAVLSTGAFASMSVKKAGASPGTTFAVEYKYNWPATGPGFQVSVKVYEARYMVSWQINMTWDPTVLSYVSITFGDFLGTQPEGSDKYAYPGASNWVLFTEQQLGSYRGKSAAEGLLATLTFTVLAPGHTVIDISDPVMTNYMYCFQVPVIELGTDLITENGYMSTLKGDTDFDGDVDYDDFVAFAAEYLKTSSSPGWTGKADFDHDGDVDYDDFVTFAANYLKIIP